MLKHLAIKDVIGKNMRSIVNCKCTAMNGSTRSDDNYMIAN